MFPCQMYHKNSIGNLCFPLKKKSINFEYISWPELLTYLKSQLIIKNIEIKIDDLIAKKCTNELNNKFPLEIKTKYFQNFPCKDFKIFAKTHDNTEKKLETREKSTKNLQNKMNYGIMEKNMENFSNLKFPLRKKLKEKGKFCYYPKSIEEEGGNTNILMQLLKSKQLNIAVTQKYLENFKNFEKFTTIIETNQLNRFPLLTKSKKYHKYTKFPIKLERNQITNLITCATSIITSNPQNINFKFPLKLKQTNSKFPYEGLHRGNGCKLQLTAQELKEIYQINKISKTLQEFHNYNIINSLDHFKELKIFPITPQPRKCNITSIFPLKLKTHERNFQTASAYLKPIITHINLSFPVKLPNDKEKFPYGATQSLKTNTNLSAREIKQIFDINKISKTLQEFRNIFLITNTMQNVENPQTELRFPIKLSHKKLQFSDTETNWTTNSEKEFTQQEIQNGNFNYLPNNGNINKTQTWTHSLNDNETWNCVNNFKPTTTATTTTTTATSSMTHNLHNKICQKFQYDDTKQISQVQYAQVHVENPAAVSTPPTTPPQAPPTPLEMAKTNDDLHILPDIFSKNNNTQPTNFLYYMGKIEHRKEEEDDDGVYKSNNLNNNNDDERSTILMLFDSKEFECNAADNEAAAAPKFALTPPMSTTSVQNIERTTGNENENTKHDLNDLCNPQVGHHIVEYSDVRDTLAETVDNSGDGGEKQFSRTDSFLVKNQELPIQRPASVVPSPRAKSANNNTSLENYASISELLPNYYVLELCENYERNCPEIYQIAILEREREREKEENNVKEFQTRGNKNESSVKVNEMTVTHLTESEQQQEEEEDEEEKDINESLENSKNIILDDLQIDEMKFEMKNVKGALPNTNSTRSSTDKYNADTDARITRRNSITNTGYNRTRPLTGSSDSVATSITPSLGTIRNYNNDTSSSLYTPSLSSRRNDTATSLYTPSAISSRRDDNSGLINSTPRRDLISPASTLYTPSMNSLRNDNSSLTSSMYTPSLNSLRNDSSSLASSLNSIRTDSNLPTNSVSNRSTLNDIRNPTEVSRRPSLSSLRNSNSTSILSVDLPRYNNDSTGYLRSDPTITTGSTINKATSIDSSLDDVLPERTRLRRQRRLRPQNSEDEPEDPIERLNRLKARISASLSEVKGVLKQYSTEENEGEPLAGNTTTSLSSLPESKEENNKEEGPVSFRFVKKLRRRSVFTEDEENDSKSKDEKDKSGLGIELKSKDETDKSVSGTQKINFELDKKLETRQKQENQGTNLETLPAKINEEGENENKITDTKTEKSKAPTRELTKNATMILENLKSSSNTEVKTDNLENHSKDLLKDETKLMKTRDVSLKSKTSENGEVKAIQMEAEFSTKPKTSQTTEVEQAIMKIETEILKPRDGSPKSKTSETTQANKALNDNKLPESPKSSENQKEQKSKKEKTKVNEQNKRVLESTRPEEKSEEAKELEQNLFTLEEEETSVASESSKGATPKSNKTKKKLTAKNKEATRRASLAAVEGSKIEPPVKVSIPVKNQRRPSDSEAVVKKKLITTKTTTSGIVEEVTPKPKIVKIKQRSSITKKPNENSSNSQLATTHTNKGDQQQQQLHVTVTDDAADNHHNKLILDDDNKNKDVSMPNDKKMFEQQINAEIIAKTNEKLLPTQLVIDEKTSSLNEKTIEKSNQLQQAQQQATNLNKTTKLAATTTNELQRADGGAMLENVVTTVLSSKATSEANGQNNDKKLLPTEDLHDLLQLETVGVVVANHHHQRVLNNNNNNKIEINEEISKNLGEKIIENQQSLNKNLEEASTPSVEIANNQKEIIHQQNQQQQQQQKQVVESLTTTTTQEVLLVKNDDNNNEKENVERFTKSLKQPCIETSTITTTSSILSKDNNNDDNITTNDDHQRSLTTAVAAAATTLEQSTTKSLSSPQISISTTQDLIETTTTSQESKESEETPPSSLSTTDSSPQINMPELKVSPAPVQTAGPDLPHHKKKVIIKKIIRQSSIEKAKKVEQKSPQPEEKKIELPPEENDKSKQQEIADIKNDNSEELSESTEISEISESSVSLPSEETADAATAVALPKKERKIKKKVIIKRQKRRLSIGDNFFNHAQSEEEPQSTEVETLEKAVAYYSDDDDDEKAANAAAEEEALKLAEANRKPLKSCIMLKQYQIGDEVLYGERFKKTQIRWRRGRIKERITSISYMVDIDGKDISSHINYLKKYTGRKVNFGGKEYLEIDYEQLAEEEERAERVQRRSYSIWNMV